MRRAAALFAVLVAAPLVARAQSQGWGPSAPPPPPPGAYPPAQVPPPLQPEKARDSWYIGFSLGGGGGSVDDATGSSSMTDFIGPDPTTLALGFRVGATLTPKLLLGLDVYAVGAFSTSDFEDTSIQVSTYGASATFFPWEKGFFLKGGPALAVLSLDQGSYGSGDWRGFGFSYGAGYEFWLGRSFNLGVVLEGNTSWYGSDGPDSTSIGSLSLAFDWY